LAWGTPEPPTKRQIFRAREWPRLRGWLEEDAEGWRLHRHVIHAADVWRGSGRDPAELYRGARLASSLDWAASHDSQLNDLERQFLDESRTATEREAERQRRTNSRLRALLAGVGVLLAAAMVAGVIAISQRQGAREAATVADASGSRADALNEERLDQALRLASAGVRSRGPILPGRPNTGDLTRRPRGRTLGRRFAPADRLAACASRLAARGVYDGTLHSRRETPVRRPRRWTRVPLGRRSGCLEAARLRGRGRPHPEQWCEVVPEQDYVAACPSG